MARDKRLLQCLLVRASTSLEWDVIERVVQSLAFKHAPVLASLLRYLAARSLSGSDSPVTEMELAREVFHRREDFDPKLDSTVRVHVSRLRSRLAAYYEESGANETIVIDLPKGGYELRFLYRRGRETGDAEAPAAEPEGIPEAGRPAEWRRWLWAGPAALALAVAVWVLWVKAPSASKPWPSMLGGFEAPLIVFSTPEFVGTSTSGLRLFQPGIDDPRHLNTTYTGTGEVIGAALLCSLLTRLGYSPAVRKSQDIVWDDAKNRPLVFLGSPYQNPSLRELRFASKFDFASRPAGDASELVILNLHPKKGEPAVFALPGTRPPDHDWALIRLFRTAADRPYVLILAGVTTAGTQAAAEFVCTPGGLEGILRQGPGAGKLVPFEAVLRVRLIRGAPVEKAVAALHFFS